MHSHRAKTGLKVSYDSHFNTDDPASVALLHAKYLLWTYSGHRVLYAMSQERFRPGMHDHGTQDRAK